MPAAAGPAWRRCATCRQPAAERHRSEASRATLTGLSQTRHRRQARCQQASTLSNLPSPPPPPLQPTSRAGLPRWLARRQLGGARSIISTPRPSPAGRPPHNPERAHKVWHRGYSSARSCRPPSVAVGFCTTAASRRSMRTSCPPPAAGRCPARSTMSFSCVSRCVFAAYRGSSQGSIGHCFCARDWPAADRWPLPGLLHYVCQLLVLLRLCRLCAATEINFTIWMSSNWPEPGLLH